jgi:type II secretory ATPase GspE/PulE/Tfp pilus assembly ATPase PilB-like protein
MPNAHLEIQTAEGRRRVPVGNGPVSIGRHPENVVVISDPVSSRRHCVIEPTANGGWRLRDLNSSNGTRLNGTVVRESRLLPGDIVTIGATRIVLVSDAAVGGAADHDVVEDAEMEEVVDLNALEQLEPSSAARGAPVHDDDDDDADVLTEDDLVEVAAEDFTVDDPRNPFGDDDAPLPLELDDAPPLPPIARRSGAAPVDRGPTIVTNQESDDAWLASLRELAASLPDAGVDEYDLAMINSRGATVHAANANVDPKRPRQDAVDLVRLLLLIATRSRATDLHMEPKGDYFQVRMRVDGSMVDVVRLPNDVGVKLNALVKILCDIDVTQKSIVQEGHFAAKVPGRKIDYRVSFAPSVFGQKGVVRVQDTALSPAKLRDLNLPDWMHREVAATLEQDQGMVLACGPTGSGKTTTLYSLIRSSDTARKNFVTIEDPVEIQIDGVTQIPVDEAEGKSFSALLRSVLRQDPDAIMVGEIRDPETARIAMQAAITGHMVFSTVHTTSTIGTIFRLLDLGVEPYLIAQGLHLVLAQRLARQLCPQCKRAVKPTAEQLARLPNGGAGVRQIYVPNGCPRCLGTGYRGRRAFFEMLKVDGKLRDTIGRGAPSMQDVQQALAGTGFQTLQQTGYQLVADGVVSIEEIERAVGR